MIPIAPSQVKAILAVTDGLGLHRESIVIPLAREGAGGCRKVVGPRLEITAPEEGLDAWLAALPRLLETLDLSDLKRAGPGTD